jgi:hypothetical protein
VRLAPASARVTLGVDRDRRAPKAMVRQAYWPSRSTLAARLEKWKASVDSRWIRSWLRLAPARTITSVTALVR